MYLIAYMEKSHSVCYVIWQYNNHIKKFFNEDCIDDTYNTVFKDISGFMDGREGELMHLYRLSFKLWSMS